MQGHNTRYQSIFKWRLLKMYKLMQNLKAEVELRHFLSVKYRAYGLGIRC